jgi:pimeloyl-ACP methyl ester carboxylesterase
MTLSLKKHLTAFFGSLLLLGLLLSACDSAVTSTPAKTPVLAPSDYPPILFVHGNGDSEANWIATIWRFESAGYPANLLFTINFPYPKARDADNKPQPGYSGTEEQRQQLARRVDEVLAQTGAKKLALVGNSRGGNSIRNYLKNGGGASKVSYAILAGTPDHGVVSAPLSTENEFNGDGPFLKGLNSGDEVVNGVYFMTIRSDHNDKFAQPRDLLNPLATGYSSPALKGAENVVLEGLDHRETAYHPRAFAEMFRFITGSPPASTEIKPEPHPQISGNVTGFENGAPTNLGVAGVKVTVYEVNQENGTRLGPAVYSATTGTDGHWGSFSGNPNSYYEFVVEAPNEPLRHFYRSPFPRSTSYMDMRLYPDKAVPDKTVVIFTRPRGYIADGRDTHSLDGKPVPGVEAGVPDTATYTIEIPGADRPLPAALNGEKMMLRTAPGEVVYAEFHY